jgi:hypothetical protein
MRAQQSQKASPSVKDDEGDRWKGSWAVGEQDDDTRGLGARERERKWVRERAKTTGAAEGSEKRRLKLEKDGGRDRDRPS